MNLLPSSLRGRNALLIVLLVLLGQVGTALLLREMTIKPRVAQLADGVARNAAALRAGLLALPPAQRAAFVQAFNARELAARPLEDRRASGRRLRERLPLTPLERGFVRAISTRLAAQGGEAVWRRGDDGRLELLLELDGTEHWIALPGVPVAREFSGAWLIATAGTTLLALAAALWFQRRLNLPLERVVQASQGLAAGRRPELLPEDGPREIATVSRSFNQLVQSLAQTERERAMMLAGISHDLRTPLTKLRLGVEILGDRIEPELGASMQRSMEEMDAIIGQFLDFARDEQDEARVPLDLAALAAEVRRAFADHGEALALEGGSTPPVPGRPQAIRRVAVNLVENALRHGRPPVVLRTGADGGGAWLEVCDAGDGIAPGEAERLKQPFRRAEGARSGPAGSGLGLAIVERIVRQHGGRLDLLPAEGGGLRARVALPGKPPDAA